jgi:hypothetical protein
MINNYANSSHIKELSEKRKEIEKHIYGAPRPHISWRDFFVVVVLIIGVVGLGICAGKKIIGPGLIKYIGKRLVDDTTKIATISEHVDHGEQVL